MSNKRLTRTEADFFVYEPGVVVPRNVTHLLVPACVEVLPNEVFRDLRYLKEVVLAEGLHEIGQNAFRNCRSLERFHFSSTLVRIGDFALFGCTSLTTLLFPEGVIEIGNSAFGHCSSLQRISLSSTVKTIGNVGFLGCSSLKRISLSSTVTTIGSYVFYGCSSLEVVILADGILTIGGNAFWGCALEDLVLPATLTSIGLGAFAVCLNLRMVKLLGGIQLIEEDAFDECHSLNHVRVTPKSLVITLTDDGDDFNFEVATDGMIVAHSDHDRVVVTSECFYSMSAAEESTLKFAIAEILRMRIEWSDKHGQLRRLLAPHERRRKEEVTTILELALWKAEILLSGGMGLGNRAACRVTCKAGGIIPYIVPFL